MTLDCPSLPAAATAAADDDDDDDVKLSLLVLDMKNQTQSFVDRCSIESSRSFHRVLCVL